MAPDFAAFVLDVLHDNWNPDNARKPILIDRRDTSRPGPREPDKTGVKADLTVNNVLGVDAAPTTTNTPTGFGFNYTYEGGAGVRIRGMPTTESGHIHGIADASKGSVSFNALIGEARRVLNAQRRWPIPNDSGGGGAYTLQINNENDMSHNYQDLYEYRFDVMFVGRENL